MDPVHPARLHARQAGRHGRPGEPGSEAGGAGQARPRGVGRQRRGGVPAHDRGDQPRGRLRQRQDGGQAALRRVRAGIRARPALRAAGAARSALQRAQQGARRRHVAARAGVRVLGGGAEAGDGRGRLPRPSRPHEAAAAVDPLRPCERGRGDAGGAHPRAGGRVPRGVRALRRRQGRGGRPRRARGADPARGPGGRRAHHQGGRALARSLSPRDRGHGRRPCARRLRLARRGRELRDRVLAA